MDCQIAQGTSFIEFDLNENTVLTSSPTLILDVNLLHLILKIHFNLER